MSVGKLKITAARLVGAVVAGVVLAGLSVARVAHADSGPSTITDNVVQINETISPEGFKHPGIRFTKESLENLRAQVIAGQEPWASYYEGMRRRHWASLDYGPRNHNGNGYPAHDVISHNGLVAAFIDDAQAALMHSVQYVVTGDERHREKAMYIVGVYSHMNPNGVEYFADVHIKMGQPIYHMTAAAEILRATSTTRPELEWTEEMTYNYVHNFLQPQMDAYIRKNHYFMNQYSYALAGNVAAAIFADDRAAYEEAVEWATVGSTAENQGWVGSIERVFRLMTHDALTGEPVEDAHVQLAEMGRDQPHAIGNVDTLFIISQIISSQGTKVDPEMGTISTASDAVDPVHFSDDALRKGYIEFLKYNMGYDIRWIPMASSILADGSVDSIYRVVNAQQRGRLTGNVYSALYYYFAYAADGYDLNEGENHYIKLAWEKSRSELGIRSGSYWGPREHVYDSEFWMHLPPSAADTSVPARGEPLENLDELPQGGPWYITEIENRHILLDGVGEVQTEGDVSYLSVEASPGQPTNFTIWYTRFRSGINAFKVRTNGPATIEFTWGHHQRATSRLYLPDTGGQWRYIPFDTSRQNTGGSGDLSFVRVVAKSGTTTVDFDHVHRSADNLAPPVFDTLSSTIVTYVGGSVGRDFTAASDAGSALYYSAQGNMPAGAVLDSASGGFSWIPASGQEGQYRLQVIAEDGEYMAPHQVDITVLSSAEAAADHIAQALDPDSKYESATREVFYAAQAAALELIEAGAAPGEIEAALAQFQAAADALLPLNPAVSEEAAQDELGGEPGSVRLDYPAFVETSNHGIRQLVDGNAGTFLSLWNPTYLQMDFGAGFRIVPDVMHFRVRQGFPDRIQGGRLEGSNDGEHWVQLTDGAVYGEHMQRLPVYPEHAGKGFRYLKVISPNCDCPVFDFGDLYLFGERKEVNNDLASALSRWFVGEPLEIPVDTSYPQSEAPEFSFDLPAGAVFDAASSTIRWTPGSEQTGQHTLTITADYGFNAIANEIPITVSADASAAVDELVASIGSPDDYTAFSLQMLERAEADARAIATDPDAGIELKIKALELLEEAVSLLDAKVGKIKTGLVATILASHQMWGNPDLDPTVSGLPIFDGDYTTSISLQDANHAWVRADYGEGRYASLTQVKFTPRPGQATRLNGASITGSNDGENWTLLASLPTDAYSSRNDNSPRTLQVEDSSQYRYLRYNGGWGSHADAAEVEYFGTTNADVDDRTLTYLMTKAAFLNEEDWSQESWQALLDAVASAGEARDEAALAEATQALDAALNRLVPASGSPSFAGFPQRWFTGEALTFSAYPNGVAEAGVRVKAVDLPDGASFDPTSGRISWTPGDDQLGEHTLRFTVSFDYTLVRLDVSLPVTVSANASEVVDEILASIGSSDQYSDFSLAMLERAEAEVRAVAENADYSAARKLRYLDLLEQALQLLEPRVQLIDVRTQANVLASSHQFGDESIDAALSGLPAFDGSTETSVDLDDASGWVQADFGEGRMVDLARVRLTPRPAHALRLNGASVEGSNDGETWTLLAALEGSTDAGSPPDGEEVSTLVIEEREAGHCGVDGTIDSNNGGFTGSGFSNTANALGNGVDHEIHVPGTGRYSISFRHANGASARPGFLIVNGIAVAEVVFEGTGSWTNWTVTAPVTVNLDAGDNWIRVEASQSDGLANIDNLIVTGVAPAGADCIANYDNNSGADSSGLYSSNYDSSARVLDIADAGQYRYLRFQGAEASHANVAEIEYFGASNFGYDDKTLPYLIAKAGILNESDWTVDSWQYLMDVLTVAQAVIADPASDESLYADATEALDEALDALVPAASLIDFLVASAQVSEADGSITLLVSRTGGTLGPVSADYATLAQTAIAGEDFVHTSGVLTWTDGDMESKAILVSLVDDGYMEDVEDFTVKLEATDNGVIGDSGEAQVTLIDDDSDALPGVSVSDASMTEGDGKLQSADSMSFEVSLSGTARQIVKVLVITREGTAREGNDFIYQETAVRFEVGEKSKIVDVTVRADDEVEDDEQFTLEAAWAKGAEIQDGVGVGTILDDD
ncbi:MULTISPECIES: Calx-beta domain-containing protein [unclassified Microbulbifer]|uniref:Calx-beta domain-containing protein n=1 Tax=unclassified Microbulbifer TaxID=2619833 RepID=UPI0027E57465|nr:MULTISPECIES: Calx-beta domain-containing protein [unclassified Microbulbifer]